MLSLCIFISIATFRPVLVIQRFFFFLSSYFSYFSTSYISPYFVTVPILVSILLCLFCGLWIGWRRVNQPINCLFPPILLAHIMANLFSHLSALRATKSHGEGCDVCIFICSNVLMTLDAIDISCLVYLNFCENEIIFKFERDRFRTLNVISFAQKFELTTMHFIDRVTMLFANS